MYQFLGENNVFWGTKVEHCFFPRETLWETLDNINKPCPNNMLATNPDATIIEYLPVTAFVRR